MNWKSFFENLLLGAAAGAAQFSLPQLPTTPGTPVKWSNVGNAALLGAILGALSHIAIPQPAAQPVPQPAVAAGTAAPLPTGGINTQAGF